MSKAHLMTDTLHITFILGLYLFTAFCVIRFVMYGILKVPYRTSALSRSLSLSLSLSHSFTLSLI